MTRDDAIWILLMIAGIILGIYAIKVAGFDFFDLTQNTLQLVTMDIK